MFSRLSTSAFDRLLERTTNPAQLDLDWEATIHLCDLIRSGEVQAKYAACAIKKKLYAANPHVSLFALQVLESCMKNSGSQFHAEVANKSFLEDLRELIKLTTHEKVKDKILELIQIWAHAFRNDPLGRIFQDSVNALRAEGCRFPQLNQSTSEAMFAANSAPQWADSDTCHACNTAFSLVVRKHHCRCCGQIFCGKCSNKQSTIPKFAIEREVRVCDSCFDKLNKPAGAKGGSVEASPAKSTPSSKTASAPPGKTEQELQEEEELQLALAMSQSEEEERKERERRSRTSSLPMATSNSNHSSRASGASQGRRSEPGSPKQASGVDAELARYLDRDYWEQKPWVNDQQSHKPRSTSPAPSAPRTTDVHAEETVPHTIAPAATKIVDNDDSNEIDNFVASLRSGLEIFVNRMNSNKLRGRPIANDSAVQSLFLNITNMHSHLLQYIQDQYDQRLHLESLQDKLTQTRDARAALDALREEHQEKLRLEAEEAERIRQAQMAQKLEIMRAKKQEYLQYQRQIALQRIQEQEAAMKSLQQTKYWGPQGAPQPMGQMPYQQPYPPQHAAPPMQYPPQSVPGSMPYQQPPPPNYPVYNMAAMGQALPPHGAMPPGQMAPPGSQPPPLQQPPVAHQPPPQVHHQPPPPQQIVQPPPPPQHVQPPPPVVQQPPPPQQVAPPQELKEEQPLISFD